MDHAIVTLHDPLHDEKRGRVQQEAELRESVGHDDGVPRSGLVFESQKAEPLRGSRTLPDDDEPRGTQPGTIRRLPQSRQRDDPRRPRTLRKCAITCGPVVIPLVR